MGVGTGTGKLHQVEETDIEAVSGAASQEYERRKLTRGSAVLIWKSDQNASHSTMCSERERQHYF